MFTATKKRILVLDIYELGDLLKYPILKEFSKLGERYENLNVNLELLEEHLESELVKLAEAYLIDMVNYKLKYVDNTHLLANAISELTQIKFIDITGSEDLLNLEEYFKYINKSTDQTIIEQLQEYFICILDPIEILLNKRICNSFNVDDLTNEEVFVTRNKDVMELTHYGDFRINWFDVNYGKTKSSKEQG